MDEDRLPPLRRSQLTCLLRSASIASPERHGHAWSVAIQRALPPVARTLGYAGVLPQAAAALVVVAGPLDQRFSALALAFAYSAVIFSFLGGVWWGLAAGTLEAAPTWIWPIGVLPSLIAVAVCVPWAAGAAWPEPSLLVLALGIAASPVVDWRLSKRGLCPPGWLRMRVHLSVALSVCTAVCALA